MNFDNITFHASSLGEIMTGSRDKNDDLGETCKARLLACYIWEKYKRDKEFVNKYTEKGTAVEGAAMTLYSRVKKKPFFKNTETFENEYFIGTPDILTDIVIDLKSSWSIHTFFANMHKALNKSYFWQLQAYMDLCGKEEARLVYCLVNTPEKLILDAERKLSWDMQVIDADVDEAYIVGCAQLRKEMTFDDIPIEERYIEFTIHRDDNELAKARTKIEQCREFLNKLSNKEAVTA